jgi:hypothetical protein
MYEELDRLITIAEAAERFWGTSNGPSVASGDGAGYPAAPQGRGRARVRVCLRPPNAEADPEAEGDGTGEGTCADALIGTIEDRIGFLRREVGDCWKDEAPRKDAIGTSLTQRVPELEAPRGPRNGHQTDAEAPERSEEPRSAAEGIQETTEPPSWWRRWLGA